MGNDDDNQGVDFHGKQLSNEAHESRTDANAQPSRKGANKEAKLHHMGHLLSENRNGIIIEAIATEGGTRQEWGASFEILKVQSPHPDMTVGANKGYDIAEFVVDCRLLKITPHVAAKAKDKGSQIDQCNTRHFGYEISQRKRKQIEECFGARDVEILQSDYFNKPVRATEFLEFFASFNAMTAIPSRLVHHDAPAQMANTKRTILT